MRRLHCRSVGWLFSQFLWNSGPCLWGYSKALADPTAGVNPNNGVSQWLDLGNSGGASGFTVGPVAIPGAPLSMRFALVSNGGWNVVQVQRTGNPPTVVGWGNAGFSGWFGVINKTSAAETIQLVLAGAPGSQNYLRIEGRWS